MIVFFGLLTTYGSYVLGQWRSIFPGCHKCVLPSASPLGTVLELKLIAAFTVTVSEMSDTSSVVDLDESSQVGVIVGFLVLVLPLLSLRRLIPTFQQYCSSSSMPVVECWPSLLR